MKTQTVLVAPLIHFGLVAAAPRHNAAVLTAPAFVGAPDACSLLSTPDASTALEVTSLPGRHAFGDSPAACIWSDDATGSFNNRRVTLSIAAEIAFANGKAPSKHYKVETLAGVGDDAYYQIFASDSPNLCVSKGASYFCVRVLNGLKFKEWTIDQEKTKEALLAKAAAARL